MQIVQIVFFLLFISVYPIVLSCVLPWNAEAGPYTLLYRWCMGWCLLYSVFYWPSVISVITHRSLNFLMAVYLVLLLLLTAVAVVRIRKKEIHLLKEFGMCGRGITYTEAIAALAVIGHALVTFLMMHIDDDDYTYVANATTSLDTNSLLKINGGVGKTLAKYSTEGFNRLVASPHFSFYAVLCRLSGTRPAAMCHTWLPPVFTCLFFSVLFLIGWELFEGDRRKTGLFVAFAFIVHISSYFSTYTAGSFLLIRSWQGKSQVAGLLIPLVLYFFILAAKGRMPFRKHEALTLAVILCAGCLLSAMGAMLLAGEAFLLAASAALIRREKRILLWTLPALISPLLMAVIYVKV